MMVADVTNCAVALILLFVVYQSTTAATVKKHVMFVSISPAIISDKCYV